MIMNEKVSPKRRNKNEFPKRITIELTNECNRECPECPRSKVKMETGYMKCSLFRKIVRQLPDKTVIVPFFRGESTLHPNFYALMKETKRFEQVQMASNGDFLQRKRVRRGILENCTFFSLSLHKHILPDSDKQATDFMWDANEAGLTTQVSIVDCNLNGDLQAFVNHWLDHADRVRIYRRHSIESIGDVENMKLQNSEGMPCRKPFNEMAVYFDGKVALCNHDWNQKFNLGNLNTDTIEKAWNCGTYKFIRHWHTVKHREYVPSCRDCMMFAAPYLPDKMYGKLYTKKIGDEKS